MVPRPLLHGVPANPRAAGRLLLVQGEVVLADAAHGAHPVLGNVLEGRAGLDAAVGVMMSGYSYLYKNVVNPKILLCKNVVICKNNLCKNVNHPERMP